MKTESTYFDIVDVMEEPYQLKIRRKNFYNKCPFLNERRCGGDSIKSHKVIETSNRIIMKPGRKVT